MLKCSGAEYKAFYSSDWDGLLNSTGCYCDTEELTCDGEEYEGEVEDLPDGAKVTIHNGVVCDEDCKDVISFEAFFKRWKKSCNTLIMVIEIPKEYEDYMKSQIAICKGKIK